MPLIQADTRAIDIGVDLSGCYVIEVNPQHIYSVTYNTNSQSGVRMQYGDVDATHRIYYVSASDAPTNISISSATYQSVEYGIRSIKDDSGTVYSSAPRRTQLKVSELPVGKPITVSTEELANILSGKLIIKYNNPEGLSTDNVSVYCSVGGHYDMVFNFSDFTNNQIELDYDPLTENKWYVRNSSNAQMFLAVLDNKQKINWAYLFSSGGSYKAFCADLNEGGTHTLDVYASVIPMDVPMRFEFENTTGNETNPEYLSGMIESVTINGKKLTDKSWLEPDFKVPNGATMSVGIKQQVRGIWEHEKSWFNGKSLSYATSSFDVTAFDPTEVQVLKMRGMYNSPWRFTLNMTNPSKTRLYVNNFCVSLPENESVYHGTAGFSAPALRPSGNNSTTEENPLAIYEVVVDGKTIPLDEDGCYYPKEMDEVITVTPREYKRDIPIQLYCNMGYYSNYSITLDPRGNQAKKIVPLKDGWQTIMVNANDLPFGTYSDDAAIYINGSKTPLVEQEGYGIFTGTKNLTANSKVKLYTSTPRTWNIDLAVANGISCTIYADDEKIEPGNHSLLHGTELKFVPTQKTGLVIEKTDGSLIEQSADGSFTIEVNDYQSYTLHRQNDRIQISCPSEKNIYVQNPVTGEKTPLKGTINELYILHYDANPNQSYTLKFFDPSGKFRVSNIVASPSSGFKYDPSTSTATGIKNGMSLSFEISEVQRLYSYDLWVSPGSYNIEGDESFLSVVYMENGEKVLIPLDYGENKKELTADNFPLLIGPYEESMEYGEITDPNIPPQMIKVIKLRDNYGDNQIAYIEDQYQQFNWWDEGITIERPETPKAIEEKIFDEYEAEGTVYFKSYDWSDPTAYGDFDFAFLNESLENSQGNNSVRVYPNSYLRIHIDPSYEYLDVTEVVLVNHEDKTTTKYPFDDEGNAIVYFPKKNEGFNSYGSQSDAYELWVDVNRMVVNFFDGKDEWPSYMDFSANGEVIDYDDLMTVYYKFKPTDEIYIKHLLIDTDYDNSMDEVITGFYNFETGEDLQFDSETGKLCGLLNTHKTENGVIKIGFRTESYIRTQSITVIEDNTSYNWKNEYELAKDRLLHETETLTKNTSNEVKFNRDQLPLELNVCTFSKSLYSSPYIYINGELYCESQSQRTVLPSVALPYNIAEGSVVRLMQTISTGLVNYSMEEGLNVDFYQDVQKVGDIASSRALAKGTIIKVVPAEGSEEQQYDVYRNGVKMTAEEAAQGFAVANATETISVEKPRNVITFTAGGATDLSKLSVVDNEGNVYALTTTDNVVELPVAIESLTILTTEEDHYISEVSTTGTSMEYDVNTGILTNLATGTLNVTSKQIEREQEVNIYVDGGQVEGATITLGSGKQIETGQSLSSGSQTVQFSEEDLPIILVLPDAYLGENGEVPSDPSQLPTVIVNGETLTYSPEHNGYVFPVEAFSDPSNPPVIKIYPAEPKPAEVTFLVEPGVTFTAVPDGDEAKTITEAGAAQLLPGTTVEVKAKSAKSGEEIFVEVNGEIVNEGTEVNYSFRVVSEGQTIELKRKKVAVTINSDEAWRFIHVSGGGFSYPLYDEASELEFPVGTTQLTLRSISDTQHVVKVINATSGSELPFDVETGVVSGIADQMKLSLEIGDLNRDQELTIYVQEGVELPHTTLAIAEGKAVEKEIWLTAGYQKMLFGDSDLPMAVKSSEPLKVYLNNTLLDYDETDGYSFPAVIPSNSVVKIYNAEQPSIKVNYNIEGSAFDVEVRHDHAGVVDTSIEHQVLPGTEITFTVDARTLARRLEAARANGTVAQVNGSTEVTVNGEALEPGEDGIYVFKANATHAADGLSFVVKRPDYVDPETGVTYSADRTTLISVPADAEGKVTVLPGVTTIAEGAFKDCTKVTSVELPESLETIEKDAFSGCAAITEVVVPNNVTTIGEGAFGGCSNLQTVVLGSSVETVAEDAFSGCTNLTKSAYPQSLGESPFPAEVPAVAYTVENPVVDENGYIYAEEEGGKTLIFVPATVSGTVTVPEDVTAIGQDAFTGCTAMTTVVVTDNVKEIGEGAFSGCSNLETVVVGSGVETIGSNAFENCDKIAEAIYPASVQEQVAETFPEKAVTIPYTASSIEVGEDGVITGKPAASEDGTVPEGKVLVYVPEDVISEEGTFTIPEDVTEIGTGAFKACDTLTEVTIPDSVEKIDEGAFSGCENLAKVDLGNSVKEIGEEAFSGTAITQIVIPDSVTEIGDGAFSGCSELETVVVGSGVETIGSNAFENCDKIAEAIYPASVKEQVAETFPETAVTIPYTASSIEVGEDGVITGKPAAGEDGTVPEGKVLVYVPDEVVSENGTYTIPEDITEIGSSAFTGCEHLTEITIPDTVEKIGDDAFSGCDNLTDIDLGNGVTEIGGGAFSGTAITEITIPETVTSIGDGAFSDCSNLTELDIPDTVENLGEGVMSGCENLSKVTIPEGVEEIGADEFKGCTSLTEVTIPESVTTIGAGAFEGCTNLETVNIPETVTSIGENAFQGCESLTEVTIPETVEEIGAGAFDGCKNLETVNIPEQVTTIGENAFRGCESLAEINIPEGVTEIGNNAFNGCSSLETVEISQNITTIGEGAFEGCTGLTTIAIPPTVEEIGIDAFAGCTNLDKCVYPDTFHQPFGEGVGVSYPVDDAVMTDEGVILTYDAIYFVPADVKEVEIPATVTDIMPKAFKDCKELTNVELPEHVTTISEEAFSGCVALTEIVVPNQVEAIGEGAFSGCTSLAEVNLGSAVTSIGADAFSGCVALHEIDIHSKVATIGVNAFKDCELTSLHIGAGVTSIGANAFAGNHLTEIAITAQTAPTLGENALGDNASAKLYVQGSAAAASYKSTPGWNTYAPEEMVEATDIVSPDKKEYEFKAGETIQLHATVQPSDAKLGAIFWESSNPSLVTVDHTGKVTMGSNGISTLSDEDNSETTITARTMYANGPVLNFAIKDISTGIDEILAEGGNGSLDSLIGKAEIITLSGIKITTETKHLEPGIYIVKYEGKTYKVEVD